VHLVLQTMITLKKNFFSRVVVVGTIGNCVENNNQLCTWLFYDCLISLIKQRSNQEFMAQMAIGERQFICAPLTISANNDGCWKDNWESKDGECVCIQYCSLHKLASCPSPPFTTWSGATCWYGPVVIWVSEMGTKLLLVIGVGNLWSGHWETTKMPAVLLLVLSWNPPVCSLSFWNNRKQLHMFQFLIPFPAPPSKPEWAVLWFFNFQKTRTRGWLLTKSNTRRPRLVCTGWIHLSNQSSTAISSHLDAFSLETWGWGSWVNFSFKKYNL